MYFMRRLYYKTLSLLFYKIGDISCLIPTEWAYILYQKSMGESVKYDDLSGAGLWKKTSR